MTRGRLAHIIELVRICLLAPNDALTDPRAKVARHLFARAGHEVVVVLPREGPPEAGVIRVEPALDGGRPAGRIIQALVEGAVASGAQVIVPTDPRALEPAIQAARRIGGAVLRTPKMSPAGDVDLIWMAPNRPEMAAPVAGTGSSFTPGDAGSGYHPAEGRHQGRKVVLCYHKTAMNPGRYVEAALLRAGVDLRVETHAIDLSTVPSDTAFVLFIEAPLPPIKVSGQTPAPVLFWFHHGEHHLPANLRLLDLYRADAALMAHSWHLAPYSPAPVHRFPFGLATETFRPGPPLEKRRYYVAMVGSKLRAGGPYSERQAMVAAIESVFPSDRLAFRERITPDEMAEVYANSRIVLNDGGSRHFPITMRVFEAVGSDAALLTAPAPGLDLLFEPDSEYRMTSDDVVGDTKALLADPIALQSIADNAHGSALSRHTYDHRVDLLFDIASTTTKREVPEIPSRSRLANLIAGDVEVARVAHLGAPDLAAQLPDVEVWDATNLAPQRLGLGKMETVALRTDDISDLRDLLRAARRYIYIEGRGKGLEDWLAAERPDATVTRSNGLIKVTLMAGYSLRPSRT